MRRCCVLAVWIALAAPFAQAEDFISAEALREAKLTQYWQLELPLNGRELTDAYLVDDQLYLATRDAWVFCVHADTGTLRWVQQTNTAGYRVWRPCHAGDRVLFIAPASARQYDRFFGDPLRETNFRFPAGTPAVSDGTHYYLGGIDRRIYCFDLNWDYEIWRLGTNGSIRGRPVLFANRAALACASEDGGVYACRTMDKSYLWLKHATAPITADLVADENGIYAACRDQSLYLLEAARGDARWRARFSGPLTEPPVPTKEIAYQFCEDDGLCAVSTAATVEDERILWKLPNGRTLLTADKRHAYVLSRDAEILVVNIEDGQVLHTIPAPGFTFAMPRPQDLTIHLASSDGRLVCVRAAGAPPLDPEKVRAALRLERPKPSASQPTSQPAAAPPVAPRPAGEAAGLGTKAADKPVGGKSKVSKSYGGGG